MIKITIKYLENEIARKLYNVTKNAKKNKVLKNTEELVLRKNIDYFYSSPNSFYAIHLIESGDTKNKIVTILKQKFYYKHSDSGHKFDTFVDAFASDISYIPIIDILNESIREDYYALIELEGVE